jgi:hypothetical protein
MATWNTNVPTITNTVSADISDIRENLNEIKSILEGITNGTVGTTERLILKLTRLQPLLTTMARPLPQLPLKLIQRVMVLLLPLQKSTRPATVLLRQPQKLIRPATVLLQQPSEINTACDGVTATATEINSGCDGMGVTIPRIKVIEMGTWDMDGNDALAVAHGLTAAKIVSVVARVVNDNASQYYDLAGDVYGSIQFNDTNIICTRTTGGNFDGVAFDSTASNRGYIVIFYID